MITVLILKIPKLLNDITGMVSRRTKALTPGMRKTPRFKVRFRPHGLRPYVQLNAGKRVYLSKKPLGINKKERSRWRASSKNRPRKYKTKKTRRTYMKLGKRRYYASPTPGQLAGAKKRQLKAKL